MHTLRVLILSDDPLVRNGLAALLDQDDTLFLAGQSDCASLDAELIDAFQPDVVLMEADLPQADLVQSLLDSETPYILMPSEGISSRREPEANMIPRGAPLHVISAALHAAAANLTVYARTERGISIGDHEQLLEPLTVREQEVLRLIAKGLTNRGIGQSLSIKETTVKFHVNAILSKLQAQSRTEAVAIGSRLGLITL